jgi:galactose-1-phosphate uridylyltransferase
MEIYETARVVASIATAIGVAIAAWQIRRNAEQTKTSFEDSLNKEYRELMRPIPLKVLVGKNVTGNEAETVKEAIYNYLDFCNQQVYLRKQNRIRKSTWVEWREGMKINLALPLFAEVAQTVFTSLPHIFKELQLLQKSGFKADPAEWH